MNTIHTINPATEEKIKQYTLLSRDEITEKIDKAHTAFSDWQHTSFAQRSSFMQKTVEVLRKNKDTYAKLMAEEMGKPLAAGRAEVEKCAWVCEYYAENAEVFLKNEEIKTDAEKSYVAFQPFGIIFAVMPWNFPFWQVFRFAAPSLMAGNTGLLKHASNVSGCSVAIEEVFKEAGYPDNVFQSLIMSSKDAAMVIEHPAIRAVTLTGSEDAGAAVASTAAKVIKKSVLELGGSDPFIVLRDADIEKAAATAALARMIVSGQSCIAAKRFIVQENIADKFIELFKQHMENMVVGNPLDKKTNVGPLAMKQIVDTIEKQVKESVEGGASIVTGGKRVKGKGYFYAPTILTNVTKDMPVYKEETFGPVAAVITFKDDEEALKIANDTRFGLGSSVWTKDAQRAEMFIKGIEAGCVFVNSMVKSDPRLPFGGIKYSGFGRELSEYGIKEFVNIKTVWIEK